MTDKPQSALPSPEILRDLVRVGVEQIRVRQQELELQEKDSQRQYEFAKQALEVQADDRRDSRIHRRKRNVDRYVFVGALLLLGSVFIVILCYLGKEEMAKEISRLAASFVAGGLSGYGISKARARREPDSDDDNEDDPR